VHLCRVWFGTHQNPLDRWLEARKNSTGVGTLETYPSKAYTGMRRAWDGASHTLLETERTGRAAADEATADVINTE
jgi:hypothetical protein